MSDDPAISVVVCSYNGAETIGDCVESLLDQQFSREYDVSVVDDGSTDGTAGVVEEFDSPRLTLIRHESNRGLGAARNTGWQQATAPIVAYIDDDAVAPEDWLAGLWRRYDDDVDGVGGVATTYYDNVVGHYEVARTEYVYGDDVDGAGGMNMSFRRSALASVGGFDEAFTHIGDDADLNRRLTEAGCTLVVDTDIVVEHRYPRTLRSFCRTKFKRGLGRVMVNEKFGERGVVRAIVSALLSPFAVPQAIWAGAAINRQSTADHPLWFVLLWYLETLLGSWGELYYRFSGPGFEEETE